MEKFLFFDVDGTLVDSRYTQEIGESTLHAVRSARSNGYGCFIASGRNYKGIEMYMDEFDGAVCSDGASVVIKGREPVFYPLDTEKVKELRDLVLNEYKGNIAVWTDMTGYACDTLYENFRRWGSSQGRSDEEMKAFGLTHLEEWDEKEEILTCDLEFLCAEDEERFMKNLDPHFEYISTSASYGRGGICTGEITAKGITKASGAVCLVEMLKGDMKNTYAFGDSMNDASLLKAVQHSICMGNGADELKAISEYVTDDIDKDGLAKAMEYYKLVDKKVSLD